MKKTLGTLLICTLVVGTVQLSFPEQAVALTAPTLVDYGQSQFTDTGTNDETASSVSWQAGDLVVVFGITPDNLITLTTPIVSGLTFSLATSTSGGGTVRTYLWTATAGSGGSGAVTDDGTSGSTSDEKGISVFVYRNSGGLGSMSVVSGTPNGDLSLTRSADNSAVIFLLGDWNANSDVTVTGNPASGATQRVATTSALIYTAFVYDWTDQGAAGATTYGVAGFSGNGNSMIVAEIKGSQSSGRVIRLRGGMRLVGGVRLGGSSIVP